MSKQLYKTTIIIWSEDPIPDDVNLEYIGRQADQGDYYCSKLEMVPVADPLADQNWDGTEFFGVMDEPEKADS